MAAGSNEGVPQAKRPRLQTDEPGLREEVPAAEMAATSSQDDAHCSMSEVQPVAEGTSPESPPVPSAGASPASEAAPAMEPMEVDGQETSRPEVDGGATAGTPPEKAAEEGGSEEATKALDIDGSILEGGGQLLRTACAYAALLERPIRVSKIRAGRRRSGVAAQHLASLRLVRDICKGSIGSATVGSNDVSLTPSALTAGAFSADPETAGSITLMVQTALLPLLYSGSKSTCEFRGGTDVPYSPSLDFLRRVLLTTLARMGITCAVDCLSRGFFPQGGGSVRLDVSQLRGPLKAIDLSKRGDVAVVQAVLHTTQPVGSQESASVEAVRGVLARLPSPVLHAEFQFEPGPEGKFKYWVDIVVETTAGALFHAHSEPQDLPHGCRLGHRSAFRKVPELFSLAASSACDALVQQLDSGAAVGPHLCDQLILPASLAQGTTRLLTTDLSLHTRTQIHVATLFIPGLEIREDIMSDDLTMLEIVGVGHWPASRERDAAQAPPLDDMLSWLAAPEAPMKARSKAAVLAATVPKTSPVVALTKASPLAALTKSSAAASPLQSPPPKAAATEAPTGAEDEKRAAPPAPPMPAALEVLPELSADPSLASREPTAAAEAPAVDEEQQPQAVPPPQAQQEVQTAAVNDKEDILKIGAGALAKAPPDLLQEFRNDMRELAEMANIEVEVDAAGNRIVLRGGAEERRAAMPDLKEVLVFYFSPK